MTQNHADNLGDLLAKREDELAAVTAELSAERTLREDYQLRPAGRAGQLAALRAVVKDARALHAGIVRFVDGKPWCSNCHRLQPCETNAILDRANGEGTT